MRSTAQFAQKKSNTYSVIRSLFVCLNNFIMYGLLDANADALVYQGGWWCMLCSSRGLPWGRWAVAAVSDKLDVDVCRRLEAALRTRAEGTVLSVYCRPSVFVLSYLFE